MSCSLDLSGILPGQLGLIVLGSGGVPVAASSFSIEAALIEYLQDNEAVSCLVGNRFYPLAVSRSNTTWPVVVYRVSIDHEQGISGSLGVATAAVELDVWSNTYSDLAYVSEAIRRAMQGFRGWWGGIGVMSVWIDGQSDNDERPQDGSGGWWFSRELDYSVMFSESVPKF